MAYLSAIAFVAAAVSLLTLMIAYLCVLLHLRRGKVAPYEFPVSVLKPLKGVDAGLLENLRAIAAQNHRRFEILFGAEDPADPALDVARQVQAEFPHVPISVIAGAFPQGQNPKVRILRHLLKSARYDWILISDSNVRPDPEYLRAMQGTQHKENADLVHSTLVGVMGRSLGGRLEELQLNGWVAASICFSSRFGHSCVIGKSMLLRRDALTEVGGFFEVADILAEDYILGAKLEASGKKVALSNHRLAVVTGTSELAHFFNRHVRWGQMRRRIAPGFFVAELSANPTPFLLLSCALGTGALQTTSAILLAAKWMVDAAVYLRLSLVVAPATLLLMPLKDLLVPVMWAISLIKRTVVWRGNVMWVGAGSRLFSSEQEARESSATWSEQSSRFRLLGFRTRRQAARI